jgi:hypothetical protein
MPSRQALLVLGMHRSGTSALAGATIRLGFARPRTTLPASDDNPDGFEESLRIVEINHQILAAARASWNICLHFYHEEILGRFSPSDHQTILAALQDEFPGNAPFVLKDPRMCVTLPAWLPALSAIGTDTRALLLIRHPAEVVNSLARRNDLPAEQSAGNWLHHMLEAEFHSRGLPRALLFYDDLLANWRGTLGAATATAGIIWPRGLDEAAAVLDVFLRKSARHHSAPRGIAMVGPPPFDQMINACWGALHQLARDPEDSYARAKLDQIRVQFARWRRAEFPPGFTVYFNAPAGG